MFSELERLSIPELRNLLLHESKKFVFALELGSTVSELETIRSRIRYAADLLAAREKSELITNVTSLSQATIEGLRPEAAQA
jgi:hypothetical protein